MRIDTLKFVFIGHEKDRDPFFIEAQKFGKIQFKDKAYPASQEMEKTALALKILSGFKGGDNEGFSTDIVQKTLGLNEELERLKQALRLLREEISLVKPFGDFDLELIKEIELKSGLKAFFYLSKEKLDAFLISSSKDFYYYLSFQALDQGEEIKIERSLSELVQKEKQVLKRIEEVNAALNECASFKEALKKRLADYKNAHELASAIDSSQKPIDELFTISGFIPLNYIETAKELSSKYAIYMEEVKPDDGETIPTFLENASWGKVGEDLVDIFDTPSNTDKDPSYWVLIGFAVFFAFIIGDGGYGALFLGLLLFLKYKHPNLADNQKRMLNLGLLLSCFCIAWGILTHAFFNISFDLDSPFRKFSLITYLAELKANYVLEAQAFHYAEWIKAFPEAASGKELLRASNNILSTLSDHVLLELSLFIGVMHMLTGMFRYLLRNIQLAGWILFLIGAYLYLPYFLNTPSLIHYAFQVPYEGGAVTGLYLMMIGVPLSVVIAIYKHGITGIFEIMNGIGIFSDALSYLRLYALALAGSIVSATINQASQDLPLIFAILLVGIAHLINMGLGIMGGVIHGLRLNFLEWYHYSFEGGGKKFKPLALID